MRELDDHVIDFFLRDRTQACNRLTETLHFLGRKVLEHLGGLFLAQRHEEDGRVL